MTVAELIDCLLLAPPGAEVEVVSHDGRIDKLSEAEVIHGSVVRLSGEKE